MHLRQLKLLKHKYIVIEGNIGSGKTTLAEMLAHRFNAGLVLESFDENSFLHRFYREPGRYAFPLELSFMADRFKQLRGAIPGKAGGTVVSDYFFDKCLLFARTNLAGGELELFEEFYRLLYPQVPRPDVVVYLDQGMTRLRQNIARRGRWYEKDMTSGYLERIDKAYRGYIGELTGMRLIRIDAARLDFVHNPADYLKIIEQVMAT